MSKNRPSTKQEAYARRIYGAKGESKGEIARDVGYGERAIRSPKEKIESTIGFKLAISALAEQSGNVASKILNEFENRDMTDYSNKDLNGALQAISTAYSKFQPPAEDNPQSSGRLRSVIVQHVQNQTIKNTSPQIQPVIHDVPLQPVEPIFDF